MALPPAGLRPVSPGQARCTSPTPTGSRPASREVASRGGAAPQRQQQQGQQQGRTPSPGPILVHSNLGAVPLKALAAPLAEQAAAGVCVCVRCL